jgi:osmotically-inducible protein OsmY
MLPLAGAIDSFSLEEESPMVAAMKPEAVGLERDVLAEIAACGTLDGARVGVQVEGNRVTLTGKVDCYARKLAAEDAARRTPGVREVINRLEIPVDGVYGWRDIDIDYAARHALRSHFLLAGRRLDVMVDDGVIKLTGEVATATERIEAERAVSTIPNLRGIRNDLVVVHRVARRWV